MIQIREYARLTTDEQAKPSLDCAIITPKTFDWLQDLNLEWSRKSPVVLFEGHRSLKLGSYVGYLQSPDGTSIEILPKTNLGKDCSQQTRKILQRMLMAALTIKPRIAGPAELLRMDQPLHEWIFSQFLSELQVLVSKGLRFDYHRIEEESRFIRGQLRLERQQLQSPAKQHLFHISHDVYSPNRLENRLLKTALTYVLKICKNSENWRLANELSHRMSEIPVESMPQRGMCNWNKGKLMQTYDHVHPWCELILQKLNPNFQQGRHKGVSLLFPMEKLFEKYVKVSLKQQLPNHTKLISQARKQHLVEHTVEQGEKSQAMFLLQPDLLLRTKQGDQILDAKWKLIDQTAWQPNEKYNITQSDLYQMFAYGHKYQDGQGDMMLIYPKHMNFNRVLPPFYYSKKLTLWVVPFCLERQKLLPGDWQKHFPRLTK